MVICNYEEYDIEAAMKNRESKILNTADTLIIENLEAFTELSK